MDGSGYAGIDGIISLDKLGLEKVYVQAKRWQNTIVSTGATSLLRCTRRTKSQTGNLYHDVRFHCARHRLC
ncbi:restriction endonuclease [Pseudomonas sp. CT11-2]|uniref:restriction endonuclease n=1 Tax=unclassified Pseudomonas TaxID=196821 RepID=UPI002852EAF8|nr:restriction endonuclease [Pseudomonas sp. B21-019]